MPMMPMSDQMREAKKRADLDAIRHLLQEGQDPDAIDESDCHTLLLWAAWWGYADIVALLLDKGADSNCRGEEGETPLMYAAFHGYTEIIGLLIAYGADVNAVAVGGVTALQRALMFGNDSIAAQLKDAGAPEVVASPYEDQIRQGHAQDIELARQEFGSREENSNSAKLWAGAWGDPVNPGGEINIFHADGTSFFVGGGRLYEKWHIEDLGDGTLRFHSKDGKWFAARWSLSTDGESLRLDYGSLRVTCQRL